MADLTASERKDLSKSDFAIPDKAPGPGSYPTPDLNHARVALSLVAANGTAEEQDKVRAHVYKKYPQLRHNAADHSHDGPTEAPSTTTGA